MGFLFNMLLAEASIAPADVRLLRHQTDRQPGVTPYSLWRDDPEGFERYQTVQKGTVRQRARLAGRFWASFVAPAPGATMFVGFYSAGRIGPVSDCPQDDLYECVRVRSFDDLRGRLYIHWGSSPSAARAWVQRADLQNKPVTELRLAYQVEAFPGFAHFVRSLSEITSMPATWKAILTEARGVYVLTCPRTREQYVGSATGEGGFLGRWLAYASDGHGGNIGLRLRSEPSDYVVSVLEVAGSQAQVEDVLALEAQWKRRLLSREIGLNRN